MSPPLLKPQLPAKVYKTEGFLVEGNFLDPDQVIMILNLILDLFLGLVDAIYERRRMVNYLKFPIGSKVVGRSQQPFFEARIVFIKEIPLQLPSKIPFHRDDVVMEFA